MTATAQNWTTNELGRWGAATEKLSKQVRMEAMAKMVLNQFAVQEADFGRNSGDTLRFVIYSNLKETGSRALGEFDPIPIGHYEMAKVELTVTEYGIGVAYTGKVKTLSELTVRDKCVSALRRDYAYHVDTQTEAEMDTCAARYVPTAAGGGSMYLEGTAGTAALVNISTWHIANIVDFLAENNCPKANGGYIGVLSVRAARGLKNDLLDIKQYTDLSDAMRGEVGKWENVRFVEENHALSGRIGTSSVCGEAYIFGQDIVVRGRALSMQVRSKDGDDFGRNPALAWYAVEGWKLIHQADSDIRQYRIVKVDSA